MNRTQKNATLFLIILVISLLPAQAGVHAQGIYQWMKPKRVPNFLSTSRPPKLAADGSGNVHAFNYEADGLQSGAIYYRRWNAAQGWSPPIDILLPVQGGQQTVQSVWCDPGGILHLIYYDGTQESGDIYYAYAYASVADRAQSWSQPAAIGPRAGPLPSAEIRGDGQGKLVALYAGQQIGNGLYEVHSLDNGISWTDPRLVSLVNVKEQWPFSVQMDIDSAGRVHAVWSLVNTEGVGVEVRYSRLSADLLAWEHEQVLARREGNDYSTNWPSVLSTAENEVMIIYQDSFPATRFMVQSLDAGETWQPAVRPFPEIGEYERAILLKDSNGNLHMILGNRTRFPEIHGMWYSRWVSNRWTALEPIISGPITPTFDPSAPQAVIVQGNTLLATWWDNVRQENLTGAWFSYTTLDAPRLPFQTLAVPTSDATPTLSGISAPVAGVTAVAPTRTPIPPGSFDPNPGQLANPSLPIFLGIIPVLLLLVGLIVYRLNSEK